MIHLTQTCCSAQIQPLKEKLVTLILPCSKKDKMDISLEEVEWTFKDPTTGEAKTVHLYFHGEDYLQKQSDDFKDRTSLFRDQLSSGNCSLSLLVTTSHSGTYHSCVGGRLCCTVTLKVLPAGGDDSSQIHQEVTVSPDKPNNGPTQNNWTIGCIVGVAVVVGVAALIGLGIYRYHKHVCCRRNPNNPQIYLAVPVLSQQPPQDEESEPEDQNPNDEQSQMLENENQDEPADGNKPADGN
ncbi:uncharacterized protein AB9X84_015275 isoform 3-T5 [Acanthopagrus schlegelii]